MKKIDVARRVALGERKAPNPSLALTESERKKALTRSYEEIRMGLVLRPETVPAIVSESGVQTKKFGSKSEEDSWMLQNAHRLAMRGLNMPRERLLLDSNGRPKAVVRLLDGAVQIEPVRFPCPKCGSMAVVAGEISAPRGSPCPECGSLQDRRILASPLICGKCDHIWIPN